MRLNYRRTILVGFAFFLICAFWQTYDTIVPLILENRFHMEQVWSGLIMSLDNIFAVFMLPLFGRLSDRCQSRYGRRTPFILFGTVCASLALVALGFATVLPVFVAVLLAALISMATFRSPAVALMPDVTCKPLRSKGNAVINLMGSAGGILVLVMGMLFGTGQKGRTDFVGFLIAVAAVMIASLAVFLLTVKEVRWSQEMEQISEQMHWEEPAGETDGRDSPPRGGKLPRAEFISLILILASVALWYTGYNAITSKYSVYASNILGVEYNLTLMIAQAAAIVSYLPVGMIASRVGRKKTILAGVLLLFVTFGGASFIQEGTPGVLMYILFALAGVAWATINVNSFPMVVELARSGNVGRYTGFYYTASMAAQIVTPILSGFLIDRIGWWIFFPYAAVFVGLSFVTMCFVRHGDAKPLPPEDVSALFPEGD